MVFLNSRWVSWRFRLSKRPLSRLVSRFAVPNCSDSHTDRRLSVFTSCAIFAVTFPVRAERAGDRLGDAEV